MEPSKEAIEEFKKIYKKEHGKELDDKEAYESAYNLLNFFKLLMDIDMRDQQKKRRLKKEPDGFPVDSDYSCLVCGNSINATTGWYDWYGNKCFTCQKAVKDGVIPTFIFGNHDSYISTWKLKSELKIKTPTVKKLIREGKLHPRTILNENGSVHEYIFLKKENPNLVEHFDPIWKSIKRHRDKVSRIWSREESKKMKLEITEWRKKNQQKLLPSSKYKASAPNSL